MTAREMEIKTMEFVAKKLGIETHTPTQYEYESYDADIIWNGELYLGEIKVRTGITSTQIANFGGAYLEHKKIERIRQYKADNGLPKDTKLLYILHYWDSIVIYKLHTDTHLYNWIGKYLPRTDRNRALEHKFVNMVDKELVIKTIPLKRK